MRQDFTVNRASKKWVLGDAGVLVEYANDEPAFEFNADGSYKGVLVEPASTNEALQSEDLDNATYWGTSNTTIASDTETDPKGGTNSFLLAENTGTGGHYLITDSTYRVTITTGETWTKSVYLKKGSGANAPDIMQLTFSSATHGAQYANFNISTGTVLTTAGGTATIKDAGNGWYRCSWTATATSTASDGSVSVTFTNNDDSLGRLPFYTGQADADVFVWGAQLEKSPIATSYIPTTTGSVTRVKDDIYMTTASSVIGQTEGTLFIEVDWQVADNGGTQYLLSVNDNSNNNRCIIVLNHSVSQLLMYARAGGGTPVTNQGESYTSYSGIQKIAFAYKTDDFELYRNGSSISTDTSGSLASLATLTNIDLGQDNNADKHANMHIRALALYKRRLSDAEAITLTTL